MKKINTVFAFAVIFVVTLSSSILADPIIEVMPMQHDFGDVELGSSVTTIITISNINGHDLVISGIDFQAGSSSDFAITMMPALPVVIGSSSSEDIEVAFTPSAEGYASAGLGIFSNDPINSLVNVDLGGVGIGTPSPMSIQDILDFFDASVAAGTLDGRGCLPRLAEFRLSILRKMLVASGNLIDENRIGAACWLLNRAHLRSDGLPRPLDFVVGEARSELNHMILQLRSDMGCE
jgi:hypothetical protein